MVTPVKYFILFSTIDFTNKPNSFTVPVLPIGNLDSSSDISPTKFFNRSVPIGPGAIFIIDTPLDEKDLLNDFNTLLKPNLNEDDIIKLSEGSLIIDDDIKKI